MAVTAILFGLCVYGIKGFVEYMQIVDWKKPKENYIKMFPFTFYNIISKISIAHHHAT
jgi:hypothetical protein